jgi:hypothetical protein
LKFRPTNDQRDVHCHLVFFLFFLRRLRSICACVRECMRTRPCERGFSVFYDCRVLVVAVTAAAINLVDDKMLRTWLDHTIFFIFYFFIIITLFFSFLYFSPLLSPDTFSPHIVHAYVIIFIHIHTHTRARAHAHNIKQTLALPSAGICLYLSLSPFTSIENRLSALFPQYSYLNTR